MASASTPDVARRLSPDQVDHYWREGYVTVPDVLSPAEVERYRARARAIARGDHPPAAADRLVRDVHFAKGRLPLPGDPERALWKLMNPDRFDPVLAECLRLPRALDALESLLGEDLLAFLLMLVYKPPGLPQSYHPFHQDGVFFPFGPHDRIAAVWIALDPVDAENGSLCVVPGSHRLDVHAHEALEGVNAGAFGARGAEESPDLRERSVTVALPPGHAVLFHPHLFHRTGGNRTDRHRRVITLHVASSRCTAETAITDEFGFVPVRGRTFPGCLQPVAAPSVGLVRYGPR